MHELALMESLVDAIEGHVGDAVVAVVRLEVGRLTCVSPDALRFCWDLCARGPALADATLEILEIEARATCRTCGADGVVDAPIPVCTCGSADLHIRAGDELRLKELEVR